MSRASLVYVMGPSGAGKTAVIDYARRQIDGALPIAFAHRYITRPLGKDLENYVALTTAEFDLRKRHGLFAFDWEAYGYRYGIGSEIQSWLKAGLTVVVDGSRAHFVRHHGELADVVPVLITAGRDELRRRLTERDREDVAAIERRLRRAEAYRSADLALVVLDNSGPLDRAGEALRSLLAEYANRP